MMIIIYANEVMMMNMMMKYMNGKWWSDIYERVMMIIMIVMMKIMSI